MKITKMEVRTTYHIEISLEDFTNAKQFWTKNQDMSKTLYPKAFKSEDMNTELINEEIRSINIHGHQAAFLADYFGFDGWEHVGFFNRNRNVKCMTVYMNGDTINT